MKNHKFSRADLEVELDLALFYRKAAAGHKTYVRNHPWKFSEAEVKEAAEHLHTWQLAVRKLRYSLKDEALQ